MARFGMHFSLWGAAWTRENAEPALAEAAKAGLQVIEIPLLDPASIDVEHARSVLAQYGITPSASLCLPHDAMAQDNPDAARAFLMPVLDTAHALGCTFLGGVTFSELGYRSGKPPTEPELANIAAALKPVAQRAAEYGMTLGIEPVNRYETHLINTAAQGVAMVERIGEPNVVVHLDTYHMNIEEKGIGHAFRAAGKHAPYVHISESDRGIPGSGTIDWDDAFAGLAAAGCDGDLVVESFVSVPPALASALSVWRPVAKDRFEILDALPFLFDCARRHGIAV